MKDTEDIPVAILAGGLATRMRPLTETVPKSLLPVSGRPFLAHQLELLRAQGVKRVVMCVGFLGEQIVSLYGDGTALGIEIEYSFDGDTQLGTGGALRRALPLLGERFFVLYGDSYLRIDFGRVASSFLSSGKKGLMTVYRNEDRYNKSNIIYSDGEIVRYDKKEHVPEMKHIDHGLGIYEASVFERYPAHEPFDLAALMQDLVSKREMAAFEAEERYYEIGSLQGLAELESMLQEQQRRDR